MAEVRLRALRGEMAMGKLQGKVDLEGA